MITAVLIVALAVILATQIGFDSTLEQRRSETALTLEQAFEVGLGAEAWAASYLRDDAKDDASTNKKIDHLGEQWATPIPPIPIDGGELEGQLEDVQGRFNLNNLVAQQAANQSGKNTIAFQQFTALLELLELEPKWANLLVDRLDSNPVPEQPDGGEDDIYMSQTPPYRSANGPLASVSELLTLPGFGLERYRRLAPHVTALPTGTPINICTASAVVLDALRSPYTGGQREYSMTDPKEFLRSRESKCFPGKDAFLGPVDEEKRKGLEKDIGEFTDYFRLTTLITIGTTEFTLYSLLHRESSGQVRPVMRSFGTD